VLAVLIVTDPSGTWKSRTESSSPHLAVSIQFFAQDQQGFQPCAAHRPPLLPLSLKSLLRLGPVQLAPRLQAAAVVSQRQPQRVQARPFRPQVHYPCLLSIDLHGPSRVSSLASITPRAPDSPCAPAPQNRPRSAPAWPSPSGPVHPPGEHPPAQISLTAKGDTTA
jgi:hypothetical protein